MNNNNYNFLIKNSHNFEFSKMRLKLDTNSFFTMDLYYCYVQIVNNTMFLINFAENTNHLYCEFMN